MSPVMKEDSCFLTVSFHIRLIRLYTEKKRSKREVEREGREGMGKDKEAVLERGRDKGRNRDKSGVERRDDKKRERNMVRNVI